MAKRFFRKYSLESYLIVFLTITAVSLGILIYLKNSNFKEEFLSQIPSFYNSFESASFKNSAEKSALEEEEKQALDIPINGTPEEQQKHFEVVMRVAKEVDAIEISDCSPKPVVARLNKNGSLAFKNSGSNKHTILISPQQVFQIPAGSEQVVDFELQNEGGKLYGYGCDLSEKSVGLFYINP